jgi:hypothetical protein
VVPGGITLWATVVELTAVQLAVNEMGAVFSKTCTSTVQVMPWPATSLCLPHATLSQP